MGSLVMQKEKWNLKDWLKNKRTKMIGEKAKYLPSVFILLFSLMGILLVLFAAAPFGQGISGDSIYYLAGAQNLAEGRGYIFYSGRPITLFPPLLSFLMAILIRLFGISALSAGNLINAFSFGLSIFMAGAVTKIIFEKKPWFSVTAAFFILLSRPLFNIGIIIATDTLFNVFVLLYFYFFIRYSKSRKLRLLLGISIILNLSVLLRYVSVLFILSGAITILLLERKNWRRGLLIAFGFGVLSSLSTLFFVILRNYLKYQTLTGVWPGERHFWANFQFSFERMLNWVIPYSLSKYMPTAFFIIILMVIFGVSVLKLSKSRLSSQNKQVLMIFSVSMSIYYLAILLSTFTYDHIDVYDDRYYLPLYFPFLFYLMFLWAQLGSNKVKKYLGILLWVLMLAFGLFQARGIIRRVQVAREGENRLYNVFNVTEVRDQKVFDFLDDLPKEAIIYSNSPNLIYLYANRYAYQFPRYTSLFSEQVLVEIVQEWNPPPGSYLVWFDNFRYDDRYITADELEKTMDLDIIFETRFFESKYFEGEWHEVENLETRVFVVN